MKVFILSFAIVLNLFCLEDPRALMSSISQHAMRVGDGPNNIYTFIDPLCSKSQLFFSLITERKDLQEKSSYYIFLYPLQKYNSDRIIQYIYQSPNPLSTLSEAILYQDYETPDDFKLLQETQTKIKEVANVAQKMKIKRRPYLLIFDKGSKYCRVSEGTAPCLEEKDFID